MARTIGIGIQNFDEIIGQNYFYIDKTHLIKEWWESGDSVTLITRPRRFGKTLNISMLEQFFSIHHADKRELFEKLSIWKDDKYRELQGTYPVIKLSFADVKSTSYASVKEEIYYLLVELYEQNRFLLESDLFSATEKASYDAVNMDMSEVTAARAIQKMCNYLSRYYGKKVIVLLDEYDTPMQEAYVNGYWEELVRFTRSMFNSTFKTNLYLMKAMMTGITRVSKESIFSDLNHLQVITTTSDKYATAFGFTEKEVFASLDECGLGAEKETVKQWYDGFIFGRHADIYNPWSVLNFLDKGSYDTYWANSSGNRLVSKLVREGDKEIKVTFEKLLKGESIICPIDEQIVYNQLEKKTNAIWSLLLASGYLKVLQYEKINEIPFGNFPKYELALTNREVQYLFLGMVKDWFSEASDSYNEFVRALLSGDVKAMTLYMNRISMEIFSFFDTGKRASGAQPERFYHGLVLGLIVELQGKYHISSNRESGFGRYDVVIEPMDKTKDALILEFKVRDSEEEADLQETVATALKQIEEKRYASDLMARGFSAEQIRMYGFAFEGKKVLIG